MSIIEILQVVTLLLCVVNYILILYESNWDFGDTSTVGWLLAVLGWSSSIF